ncbi:MAG: hypothetical protein CM1200mP37_9120 [Chloroflexota bacterium]|nr:MAG: hypothetical protein CM1200mP37_9120 [Chloroflexota bacterium]
MKLKFRYVSIRCDVVSNSEKVISVYAIAGSYFFDNSKDAGVDDLSFITMNMERGIIATLALGGLLILIQMDMEEIKLLELWERMECYISMLIDPAGCLSENLVLAIKNIITITFIIWLIIMLIHY